MRGERTLRIGLIALCCILAPGQNVLAGPQRDSVCQGCGNGPGCDPCPVSGGGSRTYNPGVAWGSMTKRNMDMLGRECGDKPLCYLVSGSIGLLGGLIWDLPYYTIKGVGYGLYYGGLGLGKGLYYTGRGIGRGLAYPFNRPPKPILPPTSWEQYKHDVIKYQKRLTKANKANKENQRWCISRVPLAASPNRAGWEARCNPGDAISRAALPVDIMVASAPPVPVETVTTAATPSAQPFVAAPLPTTASSVTTEKRSAASNEGPASPLIEKTDVAATAEPLTSAPPAGAPVPASAQPSPADPSETPQAPDASKKPDVAAQQQVIQTGVALDKSGLIPEAADTTPALQAQRASSRTLPSATPANVLTPSEYSFEGRGGYGTRYDSIWGKATPADEFIGKWNVVQPMEAMQTKIRSLAINKGTDFAQSTSIEKLKGAFADLIRRVRGTAGIVDRYDKTQQSRNVVQSYAEDLIDRDIEVLNAAANGDAEKVRAESDERLNRSYKNLEHGAVENVMGQAGDPLEQAKNAAIEKTKEPFSMTVSKNKSYEESTTYYWAEHMGIGGSKAKVIH